MKTINLHPLNMKHPNLGAVSSLLNLGERIFATCDDQYTLYEWQKGKWQNYHWPLAPELPTEASVRKKFKPDFEVLLEIDSKTLMMFPSGSKSNRTQALQFDLDNHQFTLVDLSDFFSRLELRIPLINIEGGVKLQDHFILLNRGVGQNPSSLIKVQAKTFVIETVVDINFGTLNGTALHGSELCLFQNEIYALAVAEASDNSYDDGEILGSAWCKVTAEGFIQEQHFFDLKIKTEGLCRYEDQWLVATDPDGVGLSQFFTF